MDRFNLATDEPNAPARIAYAVTPHDTNELPIIPKQLFIGGAGDVVLRAVDSTAPVTYKVLAGSYLTVRAAVVMATGTNATAIIAEA